MGSLPHLQWIFPTQELNQRLLRCRWSLYHWGFPDSSAGRVRLQCRRPQSDHWVRKIPCRRHKLPTPMFLGFPGGSDAKRIHLQCERPGFDPWAEKIPWRRERLPTPAFWPGEFHGLYSPWGCKELVKQYEINKINIFKRVK